ncbi:phenylalanine--tRNA ligase subunit alpha [candidate division NPL-UPA2 bacterium]|nr:phenylalanine--tRNA ligase subunit alpha [candidate division NPL-UPA2 bacterium]
MSRAEGELQTVVERLSPVARRLLRKMEDVSPYSASGLAKLIGESEAKAVGAIGWLIANGLAKQESGGQLKHRVSLADTGRLFYAEGVTQARVIDLLRDKGSLTIEEICREVRPKEELNPILGSMKKAGVVRFESGGRVVLGEESTVAKAEEEYRKVYELIKDVGSEARVYWDNMTVDERKKTEEMSRKRGKGKAVFRIAREVEMLYALTTDGQRARLICKDEEGAEEIDSLTPEILEKESWRGRAFRKYDIATAPAKLTGGRKHPYGLFLDFVRKKLMAMGFEEMEGRLIETEFWNNDALFMPQDHPAREIHDVYLIKEPKYSKKLPRTLVKRVAETHRSGWKTGSAGWGYEFDVRRTARFVLRSQGTANSARMLASIPRVPGKYFAIARCFRYDRVDSTHAPDFYQIEGIVISPGINFRHLLGLLKLFALEIAGSEEVKFIPSYFPFTEPSVEIIFKHEKLGWMELGGAGIFRKEVTLPLGIDIPVIAWGLGLDRMAMVTLSINDIRDLFTSDLGKILQMKFSPLYSYLS